MTYKANPIHEAADKVAELTGIPRLIRHCETNQQSHIAKRQIVLPAVAIFGSIAAFVATLSGLSLIGVSAGLFFLLAFAAQYFGPIRPRNAMAPYDEREQLLIWRSRSIGLGTGLAIAIIGCAVIAVFDAFQDLQPTASWRLPAHCAMAAMWMLVTTATGMTTISASLLLPKQNIDDED